MADKYDDRNRQGKALERWEQQQKMWDKLTANLAKKVGKADPSATLPGSIHHFRMRQEESTLLDASVPPEVKSGHHAWEMNLRNYDTNATGRAGGGFRYVQFGVPHPYPLYVPVRDGVSTDPESNTLTRVIVDKVAPRHKPISESQYYHQRQSEYKKHIKRIFAHFIPGQDDLVVYGRPPPLINSKELSDGTSEECFQPVVFYPPPEPRPEAEKPSTPSPSEGAPQQMAGGRSRSSVAPSEVSAGEERKKQASVGPALTISAASLVARVRPGELAQLTLCAANAGSTAIFYQWAARDRDPVPGLADKPAVAFDMADVPTGVLLPGEQKLFTFSYRPLCAGSFSQTMDLNTVPAGKERILVHLQVFALSEDENPAATKAVEEGCSSKEVANDLRTALWGPISAPSGNGLTKSDLRTTTSLLEALQSAPRVAHAKMVSTDKANWEANNNLAKETLPAASCPFREAYAHQLQVAKDGRTSASLMQQQQSALFPPAANEPPTPAFNSAVTNPANADLFAADGADVPYQEVVHAKLKGLFGHLQTYKAQCAALRDVVGRLEPRPPPMPAVPEGRPKSGGLSAAAKAQQQALLAQQQAMHQQAIEQQRAAREAALGGDGFSTPRQPAHGRASLLNSLMPSSGISATVATAKPQDPQLLQVVAQEHAILRAVRSFEGAVAESNKKSNVAPSPTDVALTQSPTGLDATANRNTPLRSSSPTAASSPQGLGAAPIHLSGPTASPSAAKDRALSLQWDGSVRMLLEEIGHVRDAAIRNGFLGAAQLLLRAAAASANKDGEACGLTALIEQVAVHDAMEEALESVDHYAHTARGVGEGKMARRTAAVDPRDKSKGSQGQGKKGPAAAKNARPGSADARAAAAASGGASGDDARLPSIVDTFYSGAANIYEDAVAAQIANRKKRYLSLIASVCDQPVTVSHHRRMELVRQELLSPHTDVDPAAEPTKKKR